MVDPALSRPRLWQALGWFLILAVIYLSLVPKPPMPDVAMGDKFGHLFGYALLMMWWLQIRRQPERLALAFVVMGLMLEILQSLSGYRDGDIFDLAANTLGVGLGWFATRLAPTWLTHLDKVLAP